MPEYDLARFVAAQDPQYAQVLNELRAGHKTSHWMWYVFPQIQGLGSSDTSRYYAVASLAEARDYLAHPILGPRLLDEIFGEIDAMKFRSTMTLFHEADAGLAPFREALDKYCGGMGDARTLALLGRS